MRKIIQPSSWDFDAPIASLVDCHGRGVDAAWMSKRAASEELLRFSAHKAAPGHSLIHLIAMGDAETTGFNRNADAFYKTARQLNLLEPDWDRCYLPRLSAKTGKPQYHAKSASTFADHTDVGTQETCQTFVSHGKVFKNHKNKSTDPVYGSVKAAAHNTRMGRVELLIEVPHGKDWDDDLQKLASGTDIPFSMSCSIPYDICSGCGHKSPHADQYCKHIVDQAGEILKSGHYVGMVNDHMTFFDISRVHKPADRIAWSLMKAAGAGITLSADLALDLDPVSDEAHAFADPAGVRRRKLLLDKAAEIEKTVPALAVQPQAKGVKASPTPDARRKLASARGDTYARLPDIYRALADASICLPLRDWAGLTLGLDKLAALEGQLAGAEAALPGILQACRNDLSVLTDTAYTPAARAPDMALAKLAAGLTADYGLAPEALRHRAVTAALTGTTHTKRASSPATPVDPASLQLAKRYTAYKLAFWEHVQGTQSSHLLDSVMRTSVLQNALH